MTELATAERTRMLTDFFMATPDEIVRWDMAQPAALVFGAVQGLEVDALKLATLIRILEGRNTNRGASLVPVRKTSDQGPWIYELPARAAATLAALSPVDRASCAESWARAEGWTIEAAPAFLSRLLEQVQRLAAAAKAQGMNVYLWVSV